MFWDKVKAILKPGNKEATAHQATAAQVPNETHREEQEADSLMRAQHAGHALAQSFISGLTNERGVHVESLLCALGSLAGHSVQASLRELRKRQGGEPEGNDFAIVQGKDGKKYFFGDALNGPLAEGQYSVWSLAAGAATRLGCEQPLKVEEIFKHVAATVGSSEFGIPRISENHRPGDPPSNWVKYAWPKALGILQQHCASPEEWPVAFGIAIQDVMEKAKAAIDPCLALSIVMECAIPMSKLDATTL